MIGIKVVHNLGKLVEDLDKLCRRAIPYAMRDTLNGSAFALQKNWRAEVKQSYTLRNQYTERAIRVDKARGTTPSTMQAVTGTVAPYMPDQEDGGTVKGRGKHKAIPTAVAAGQAPGSKRTRTVRTGLRLSAITIPDHRPPRGAGVGRRRQNAVAMAIAIRKGERFAMLNFVQGRGRGIFEVRGGKRSGRARLIWNMSKSSVKVPRSPTLMRSIVASQKDFERVQGEAFLKHLRRNKIMGY